MELRAIVVEVNKSLPMLMVLTLAEELQLRTFASERRLSFDVYYSEKIDAHSKVSIDNLIHLFDDVETLVMTSTNLLSPFLAEFAVQAHLRGCRILGFQSLFIEIEPSVPTDSASVLRAFTEFSLRQKGSVRFYQLIKDTFEPLLAFLMLLILSPIIIIAAIAIKLTSKGPVFYSQVRAGKGGKPFHIYKFRSMRTDAEKAGPVWATAKTNDERLTPIGGFIRASHIDEIPQIWNVLKGEVSFVGPRPERPVFIEKLRADVPLFELRTAVKPGITGWAQVRQGYANSVDDSRRKLELDLYYILKRSPSLDFKIVLATLGIISKGGTEGKKRQLETVVEGRVDEISTEARPRLRRTAARFRSERKAK